MKTHGPTGLTNSHRGSTKNQKKQILVEGIRADLSEPVKQTCRYLIESVRWDCMKLVKVGHVLIGMTTSHVVLGYIYSYG